MSPEERFTDTLELIQRAKSGDREALTAVLLRYRPRLLERVRLMMGARARRVAESGDFLHGVFTEVLVRIESFEPRDERSFLRWTTAIARNGIREEVRRRRDRAFACLSDSLSGDSTPDTTTPSPSTQADLSDKLHRLAESLERLSADDRQVIELRNLEELTFHAIADRLGCSKNGARLHYHRALVELGRLLGQAG